MRLVVRKCSAHRAKGMDSPVGVKMSESRSARGVDRCSILSTECMNLEVDPSSVCASLCMYDDDKCKHTPSISHVVQAGCIIYIYIYIYPFRTCHREAALSLLKPETRAPSVYALSLQAYDPALRARWSVTLRRPG